MATTADIQSIWPPNATDAGPNQRRYVCRVTITSTDATNLADEIIVNKSDLTGPAGAEPSKLVLEEAEWSVAGYDCVILEWDDGTDEEMLRLSGAGFKDYRSYGGMHPAASGNTGDVIATTQGGATNAAADITLHFRLKA